MAVEADSEILVVVIVTLIVKTQRQPRLRRLQFNRHAAMAQTSPVRNDTLDLRVLTVNRQPVFVAPEPQDLAVEERPQLLRRLGVPALKTLIVLMVAEQHDGPAVQSQLHVALQPCEELVGQRAISLERPEGNLFEERDLDRVVAGVERDEAPEVVFQAEEARLLRGAAR